MPNLKKLNQSFTNLQSAIKILDDAMETFSDELDKVKEDIASETKVKEEEEEE